MLCLLGYKGAKVMSDLRTRDGLKLFKRSWPAKGTKVATLLFIHGFAEHSGRYAAFAEALNERGITVEAIDLRGHGRSEGRRTHLRSMETVMDDLERWISGFDRCFLMGYSVGGQAIAKLMLSGRLQEKIVGIIMISPCLSLCAKLPRGLATFARIGSKLFPRLRVRSQMDVSIISRDTGEVQLYKDDPMVHERGTLASGAMLLKGVKLDFDPKEWPPIPTLIFHGDGDQITSHDASKAFATKVGAQFRSLPGAHHDLLHELPEVRTEVIKEIGDFILSNK